MTTERSNTDIVRRFIDDAVTGADYDVAREILSDDYERHDPNNQPDERGPEPFVEMMQEMHNAFPDASWSIGNMITEGDLVAFEGEMAGTHEGAFMGIEPTGQSFSIRGNAMHRIEDGQIAETWATWDIFGMMQQLQAIEAPAADD